MSKLIYISVDVEADGPIPGPYSMSSFGAVVCAYATRAPDLGDIITRVDMSDIANQFYTTLKPISEHFVPEAAAVSGLDRDELVESGADPVGAMQRFAQWLEEIESSFGGRAVFVGWPLSYDWMWIYWYLMNFAGRSPFGFSDAVDAKSWAMRAAGRYSKFIGKRELYKAMDVKSLPHTHNALDDAIEQGALWQELMIWDGAGR